MSFRKISIFTFCLLLSHSLLFGQDLLEEGKINPHKVYRDAYREALSDGKIDKNEARILKVLGFALGLSSAQVLEIQSLLRVTLPEKINKEGEWLVFVQNIGWSVGLYGWGLPVVLGFEERGILAGELMAPFLSYKLTAILTRDSEMDHARAQLIRWGSTIGFRYGLYLNKMRNFESVNEFGGADEFDDGTITLLMLGVPLGSFAGDWVWRRSKPSTGLAFVMTFWGETGAAVSWDRKHNLFAAVGYPLGMWLGHRQFKDRQYSFGDAVLIHSSGLYGWVYGAIITELIGIDFEDNSAKVFRTAGTVAFPIIADRYMKDKNYSFGQAVLISSGGIVGGLFSAGILVVFNVQSKNAYLTALLAGATFGLHYANSRLNVSKEFALTKDSLNQKVFTLQPTILGAADGTHIPALSMNIIF